MKILLLIVIGLVPAAILRYLILRKPMSRIATAASCFGILMGVAVLVSTGVENKSQRQGDEPLAGGPITILANLVGGMVKVGVPVLIASYFILRSGTDHDADA